MFFKIGVLKNFAIFSGKHLCWSPFLINKPEGLQRYQKETPTQVCSCEYCEIFKNSFFYRTPLVAASVQVSPRVVHLSSLSFKCLLNINVNFFNWYDPLSTVTNSPFQVFFHSNSIIFTHVKGVVRRIYN